METKEKRQKELLTAKRVDSVKLEDKILLELRVLQNRLFGSPQHRKYTHTNPMSTKAIELPRVQSPRQSQQQQQRPLSTIPQVSRFSMRGRRAFSQEIVVLPAPSESLQREGSADDSLQMEEIEEFSNASGARDKQQRERAATA